MAKKSHDNRPFRTSWHPPRRAALLVAALVLAVTVTLLNIRSGRSRPTPRPPFVPPDPALRGFYVPPAREPHLTHAKLLGLLRRHVRYVFVLYQENRSFDSYFGTFPGADGIYSQPASRTLGFSQPIENLDGTVGTIHPFRIGPSRYAADLDDPKHDHPAILAKIDVRNGRAYMDHFALAEEKIRTRGKLTLKARQFGELTMAHVDGDTIPFLWRWANRFTLFDHIFQEMTAPSTPGNLSVIGAQTGVTQWMLHPSEAARTNHARGVPVVCDLDPFWGSPLDPTHPHRMPSNPRDYRLDRKHPGRVQINLTYATLPLTLARGQIRQQIAADRHPGVDLADVRSDVGDIARSRKGAVNWGWFQEGYDRESPTDDDSGPLDADGVHASYITHHDGPSYFGYVSNNATMRAHLHGLEDFYHALATRALSPKGGVYYVKGGFLNARGMHPADPGARAQATFRGNDDHPGYSDSQISEALLAETINRISRSPYWSHCAIVIAWDDAGGMYDHVRPPVRSIGPDGKVLCDGARVPLLVLSPYARTHVVVHDVGDHASIVKFIDEVFALRPLADLPAEREGRRIGEERYHQSNLGPFDDLTAHVTDLLGAFDPARLTGAARALPAWYVRIPEQRVRVLPQASGYGWRQIGVEPVDYRKGIPNNVPPDFNPRPVTEPSSGG